MKAIYNTDPGDVYWAGSDVGWVVGHSYIVYAPLLHGCTSVMFEGKPVGTPDAGVYWRIIEQYRVANMFTAPTALRAIRKFDPKGDLMKECDISSLRTLFVAGERADPDTVAHFEELVQGPVVDHWWQTESGSPMCGVQLEDVGTTLGSCSSHARATTSGKAPRRRRRSWDSSSTRADHAPAFAAGAPSKVAAYLSSTLPMRT